VAKDLASLNLDLHAAWRNAQNRVTRSRIVNTAILSGKMLAAADDGDDDGFSNGLSGKANWKTRNPLYNTQQCPGQ